MSNFSGLVKVDAERVHKAVTHYANTLDKAKEEWEEYKESLRGQNIRGWIFKKDDYDRLMSDIRGDAGWGECGDYGSQFIILDEQWYFPGISNLIAYQCSEETEIYLNADELKALLWMEGL